MSRVAERVSGAPRGLTSGHSGVDRTDPRPATLWIAAMGRPGAERAAQFVAEHREEIILRAVQFIRRFVGESFRFVKMARLGLRHDRRQRLS